MQVKKVLGKIDIGDKVFVDSLNSIGDVINIDEDKYLVKIGFLTTWLKRTDVSKIENKEDANVKSNVDVHLKFDTTMPNYSRELNIIGVRYSEVESLVNDYLTVAKAKGYSEVRIVHGKGTGALRKATHEALNNNKNVASFRIGSAGEGDFGVTIVTLK